MYTENDLKITADMIQRLVSDKRVKVTLLEHCDSTNSLAREYAADGAAEYTVIIARSQSYGRGRMGRSFFSPENTGLYMSIILRPLIKAEAALEITTAAAIAAARVIDRYTDKAIGIKWVNDIYKDNKKVCGILTETCVDTRSGYLDYAVLGIGVNLFAPLGGFPEDIRSIAASVLEDAYDDALMAKFTAELIRELLSVYKEIGNNSLIDEYRSRSIIIGENIYILEESGRIPATAISINDDYSLNTRLENDEKRVLNSSDVSIRQRS